MSTDTQTTQADPFPAPGTPAAEAIRKLLDTEAERLYSLGLRFCGNATDAVDLVQETFLEALKSWKTYRGESSPRTWLFRIAYRACSRMHKKAGRACPTLVESFEAMADGAISGVSETKAPLETLIDSEMLSRVEREIAGLADEYRVPLVLKEIAGFSVLETADVMGIPEGTVKTRLHRARLAIRDAATRSLPRRDAPPPAYGMQVCLDLLNAKQDALDRGVPFDEESSVVCARCRETFRSLDLTSEVCKQLRAGSVPDDVRERIRAELNGANVH